MLDNQFNTKISLKYLFPTTSYKISGWKSFLTFMCGDIYLHVQIQYIQIKIYDLKKKSYAWIRDFKIDH